MQIVQLLQVFANSIASICILFANGKAFTCIFLSGTRFQLKLLAWGALRLSLKQKYKKHKGSPFFTFSTLLLPPLNTKTNTNTNSNTNTNTNTTRKDCPSLPFEHCCCHHYLESERRRKHALFQCLFFKWPAVKSV